MTTTTQTQSGTHATNADHQPARAVAYIRVSLERPGMLSPELQLTAIEAHCERLGYEIVEVVPDIDESGRRWDGRKIEGAVAALERGEADVLVVSRWSRLSRSRMDWALAVERIERAGGRVESASEPIDTSTSAGRYARNLFAEQAAFESDRQAEYSRETRRRRVADGLPPDGRDRFGYVKNGRSYEPDPVAGKVLAALYRQYVAGRTFQDVTLWLAEQDARTDGGIAHTLRTVNGVQRCLDAGFGAGLIWCWGQHWPGRHKAVITQAQWRQYQAARAVRRHGDPRHKTNVSDFSFLGFVVCAEHGQRMGPRAFTRDGKLWQRFHCGTDMATGVPRKRCNTFITENRVTLGFRQWMQQIATDEETGQRARNAASQHASFHLHDARVLERGMSERGETPDQLAALERLLRDAVYQDPVTWCRDLLADWDQLSPIRRRRRIGELVHHIDVLDRQAVVRGVDRVAVRARWQANRENRVLLCKHDPLAPDQVRPVQDKGVRARTDRSAGDQIRMRPDTCP